MMITAEALPTELTSRPQWVVWRRENRHGKLTKVPYSPRTGRLASSTNPATWGTSEDALAYHQTNGQSDGVGFVFSVEDPYAGVECDHCRDPETGAIEPWAQELIDALKSYTEVSPSGTGVHVIAKGNLPPGGRKRGNIEMYCQERYFTVTGDHLEGTPTTIEERTIELTTLHAWIFGLNKAGPMEKRTGRPSPVTPLTDTEIIDKALAAANGPSFAKLWAGDWSEYDSQSEADLALCNHLAFWTGGDRDQMDRLFRQSGLHREKWHERHYGDGRTYGQATIARAVGDARDFYLPGGDARAPSSAIVAEERAEAAAPRFHQTDAGNAELFAHLYGDQLRYDHRRRRWLRWRGNWWKLDADAEIQRLALEAVRYRYHAADSIKDRDAFKKEAAWAMASESHMRLDAALAVATALRPIADDGTSWDADSWLLGVANGVVDLRTGELRDGQPEDRLTMHSPVAYDPDAPCPHWLAFLDRVLDGNDNLIDFLQRAIGYSLTGDVSEQVLLFLFGTGANGKSTFLTAILDLLGDYGRQAAPGLLLAKRGERHPTEYADLEGSRFVASVEVDEGRRLAEGLVKWLTGGDRMKARKMRQDFHEFKPTYKIWLAANHRPTIAGTDLAIWRRIRLVPFSVIIPPKEQDKDLPAKLRAELPGILDWAVQGCLDWQRHGLGTPQEVENATEAYRAEQDVLAAFLDDCCRQGLDEKATAKALYHAYSEWAKENGEQPMPQRTFGAHLSERGFSGGHRGTGGARWWHGIGLVTQPQPDQPTPTGRKA